MFSSASTASCPSPVAGGLRVVGGELSSVRKDISVELYGGNDAGEIKSVCSATYISSRTILTAGHCLAGMKTAFIRRDVPVTATSKNRVTGSEMRRVDSFKVFPLYNNDDTSVGSSLNDVALVTVAESDAVLDWAEINLSGVSAGPCTPVNWVGYGDSTLKAGVGRGGRRVGFNQISSILNYKDSDQTLRRLIEWSAPKDNISLTSSFVGMGDSGAGLFNDDGEVVGVVNAKTKIADVKGEYHAYGTDLSDPKVSEWINDNI